MKVSEQSIREHVKSIAHHFCGGSTPVLLVEELELLGNNGAARIDMVFVGEHTVGIEIKSPKDTLVRLPRQIEIFSCYFDYLILIADQTHIRPAKGLLPPWWGVIEICHVQGRPIYRQSHQCQQNPLLDIAALTRLLWKAELIQLVKKYSSHNHGQRQTKQALQALLVSSANTNSLRKDILGTIRARSNWRAIDFTGFNNSRHLRTKSDLYAM